MPPTTTRFEACRLIGSRLLALVVAACTSAGGTPATSAPARSAAASTPAAATGSAASPSTSAPSVNLGAEVDATVAGLDAALGLYRAGNQQGALDALAETYEEHFELIEDPLENVNDDLKEDLEGLIATKLRQAVQAKAPVADVEKLVAEAQTMLATAKSLLK
jgi:hypothetical protein